MEVLPRFVQPGESQEAEPSAVTQVCSLCDILKVSHKKKNTLPLAAEMFVLSDFCMFHSSMVCGGYCSAADDCAVIQGFLKYPRECFGSFYLLFT